MALPRGKAHWGRGSGRGRGRGGPPSKTGGERGHATPQIKPRLTHFIALPIGHHPRLRERISSFTSSLMQSTPPIPGLDPSIIVHPRRLHLTLGVMSLSSSPPPRSSPSSASNNITDTGPTPKTLTSALTLLRSMQPRISQILAGNKLRVALDRMDIMPPERRDPTRAHVLWLGPALEGGDAERLKSLCEMINREFMDAGLVVDEKRPLKLHCTIINTSYRKPRPRGARQPFSYSALLASTPFRQHATEYERRPEPVTVDFGTWDVDEIQICEMGSWGSEGEYVSCGSCPI